MATLHVHISLLGDDGARPLDVELQEPTRIDVDRDPLFVFGRLEGLTGRALAQLHDQVLRLIAASGGTGATHS